MNERLKAINPLKLLPDQIGDNEKNSIREVVQERFGTAWIEQVKALREAYGWGLKETYTLVSSWRTIREHEMWEKLRVANPLKIRANMLPSETLLAIKKAVAEIVPEKGIEQWEILRTAYNWSQAETAYAMMEDEPVFVDAMEHCGVRAINVPQHWYWMPGMVAHSLSKGWKQRVNAVTINNMVCCNIMSFPSCDKDYIPDFSDPTTMDCLRGLVMKAYSHAVEFSINAERQLDLSEDLPPQKVFIRVETKSSIAYFQNNNEVESLVRALEQVHKTKEK